MPTTPATVADQLIGAMLARDPILPLGLATGTDAQGAPLYMVAVVLGAENIARARAALEYLRPEMVAPTAPDPIQP